MFETEERRPLTVTELNEEVRSTLERDFSNVWLEGEIVNFSEPSSGHWYFTLSDGSSVIKAACFKGSNWRIRFRPFDGLLVRVRGKVSVYGARGEYQIVVESLEPVGDGALKVAFDQIKEKLRAEGLFAEEHKRSLPFLPKRVGVVTSPTGAAIHDIINVLSRRTHTVDIVLIPAQVQGDIAPKSIRDGILLANEFNEAASQKDRLDVLIVGRGGGSAEDLAAFNEERLARTIFESEIPVISAVGHEIDVSISDFVADARAATPSAAAELVAQREDDLLERIRGFEERTYALLMMRINEGEVRLNSLSETGAFRDFPERIRRLSEINERMAASLSSSADSMLSEAKQRVTLLEQRLSPVRLMADVESRKDRLANLHERSSIAIASFCRMLTDALKNEAGKLHALSPLNVLQRGYSITRTAEGRIVNDAHEIRQNDRLNIRLARGKIEAEVLSKEDGD
ncbi:MAG: exodeoxyribonuclease VII large subunit [Pyrinomonadaceae bacterium]|nr:exodeoxyribonuclease VII large subunit [Pyrinomonadaceae bacterium]